MKRYLGRKKIWILLAFLLALTPVMTALGPSVPVYASDIKLNKTKKTIIIGDTYQLRLVGTNRTATWRSSDKKVAAVSGSGRVTARKAGTATITAKVGKKQFKCEIKVVSQQKAYCQETIRLLNKQRRRYGYASFKQDILLQSAAQKRAKELSKRFSHTRPNGYSWASSISMKYDFKYAAENIACDFATPDQVVTAWMGSASSKSKIISKKYNEIGVGIYLGTDGYLYWCAIFAKEKN